MTIRTIRTEIIIHPSKLHILNEYVQNEIRNTIEKTIFSNHIGFVDQLVDIEEIMFSDISFETHDGSVIFAVTFTAQCINPQKNDILECHLRQNENFLYCIEGPLHIVIRQPSLIQRTIKKQKIIVLQSEVDIRKNIIKVVADLYND